MTEPGLATTIPASPAPVEGAALLCPLCTYDLRGLINPRCPECGYQFVWADLLDEKKNRHPYLFEHHPRHNTWSFVRTTIGGLNPVRFWRTLRPRMTPRRGRLFIYWVISALVPAILAIIVMAAGLAVDSMFPYPTATQLANGQPLAARSAFADGIDALSGLTPPLFDASAAIFAWTGCTFLTLMVFQQSMVKAKIRCNHVWRCVCYGSDLGIWSAVATLAFVILICIIRWYGLWGLMDVSDDFSWVSVFVLWGLAFSRLWAAYRLYLCFDHAFWVVLSSQIVVFLFWWTVAVNIALIF